MKVWAIPPEKTVFRILPTSDDSDLSVDLFKKTEAIYDFSSPQKGSDQTVYMTKLFWAFAGHDKQQVF